MKFDFSKSSDLQNKLQLQLDTINKNVLYSTRQLDKIAYAIKVIESELNLTKQANEYYQSHIDEPKDQQDIPARLETDDLD